LAFELVMSFIGYEKIERDNVIVNFEKLLWMSSILVVNTAARSYKYLVATIYELGNIPTANMVQNLG
jgi:hypothetical protein